MSHRRATIVVVDMERARQEMVEWLLGADARAAAVSDLHRLGLAGYDAGDLVNDVYLRLARTDLQNCPANPKGYVRRMMQNRATDLLRGERVRQRDVRRPAPLEDDEQDRFVDIADPAVLDPSGAAVAIAGEDAMRRALHLRLVEAGTKTWTVAAALTTLTLRVHANVALPEGVPEPEAATPGQADRWAALWLAGEVHVFGDDAATRKARSRRLHDVENLLRQVACALFKDPADG